MRVEVALAIAALIALIAALATGSTWPAVAVVALAGAGIVLLLRDWRADRPEAEQPAVVASDDPPHADEFSPDISTDPDGPSSDARSDQL